MDANPSVSDSTIVADRDWIERYLESLEATIRKMRSAVQAHQHELVFSCGVVACFYGRHLTYSVFFWQAFVTTAWPATCRLASELRQRFHAGRAAARREMPGGLPSLQEVGDVARQGLSRVQAVQQAYEAAQQGDGSALEAFANEVQTLQDQLGRGRQTGAALGAISAEVEPEKLMDLFRDLRSRCLASVKTATSTGSTLLGSGVNIGDLVATTVNRSATPRLRLLLDAASHSSTELRDLREDANVQTWMDRAIRAFSRSIGVTVASYVEACVFTLSNARMGAALMVREMAACLQRRGFVADPATGSAAAVTFWAEWILCGLGVYAQIFRGSRSSFEVLRRLFWAGAPLPFALRWSCGPPLMVEVSLQATVFAMRGGLLD